MIIRVYYGRMREPRIRAVSSKATRPGSFLTAQQSDPARDPTNSSPNAGYVYKVHIGTEQPHFVDGEARPVVSGMTVQADITTDRRRVIDFFLSPVVKYLDEGMKVR